MCCYLLKRLNPLILLKLKHDWKLTVDTIYRTLLSFALQNISCQPASFGNDSFAQNVMKLLIVPC